MMNSETSIPSKAGAVEPDAVGNDTLLDKMRHNYEQDAEADSKNRTAALEDIRYINVPGAQWDFKIRQDRGDRPMYTFNKLRVTIKRVVNDMRSNRPAGKVRATEDGDVDKAEIREGLIRNILSNSDFDTVIDNAAESQVTCGMGAWRINTELPDDEVVNQDITAEAIRNPFCLLPDRHAQDLLKRDANHWTLTTMLGFDTFEATYGKEVDKASFESLGQESKAQWITDDTVRVCEYWYKKPVKRTLLLLQDGKTIDAGVLTPEQTQLLAPHVVKSREVKSNDIYSCIATGKEVIKGPTKWAGSKFPFVIVYGEHVIVDGEPKWFGLTRNSKDAQTAYNVAQTAVMESIFRAPQAKFWATPAQALGLQDSWAESHKKNIPALFYNPDPKAPGPPTRMGGADVPSALIELSQIASEDIKSTSGIFDNSLGKTANETSGIAIRARQQQGEIATFNYSDNLSKCVCWTWEIIGDLLGKIYDGQRIVRILGKDGSEKFHKLNETVIDPQTGQEVMLNDMSEGKYDYTVTSGPSFATQRQEAAETYGNMMQGNPALFPLIGDLVMKATDLPYAEEIAERLKAMLPPQLQEQDDGKPLDPKAMQAMQQAAQAMQHVQEMTKMLQDAQGEVEQGKQELTAEQSKLAIQKAELDAAFQKYMGQIIQKQAAFEIEQAKAGADAATTTNQNDQAQHHVDLNNQMSEGLAEVKTMAAEYIKSMAESFAQMQANNVPQVVVANPPKRRSVRVKRVNGELHGEINEVPDQGVQPQ